MASLIEKLTNLLELTTAHGIPNLIRSKNLSVKIIWVLSLALSTSACVYFLYYSLFNYYGYEYTTKVIVVNDPQPDFPVVSFCINSTNRDLNDIFIGSTLRDISFNSSDFVTVKNHGESCFRFNSLTPTWKATSADIGSGLFVLIHTDSYYKNIFKLNIFIQNRSSIFSKNKVFSNDPGEFFPGGFNIIKVTREFVQNLPAPYNDCVKQDTIEYVSDLFQYFIRNNLTYTQKDCKDLCVEQLLYEKCNCSVGFNQIIRCYFINPECIINYVDKFITYRDHSVCLKKCPLECDYINYIINSNYIGKLNDILINQDFISNNWTVEGVGFLVYYSDLNYKLISQIPKTEYVDLISNLGGTLGLFLGVSFLSFVELIEILMEALIHLRRSAKVKSNN